MRAIDFRHTTHEHKGTPETPFEELLGIVLVDIWRVIQIHMNIMKTVTT